MPVKKKKKTGKKRKVTSAKQKAALAKGHVLMKAARNIQKGAGKKTIPAKKVFKLTMSEALKKAALQNRKTKASKDKFEKAYQKSFNL